MANGDRETEGDACAMWERSACSMAGFGASPTNYFDGWTLKV